MLFLGASFASSLGRSRPRSIESSGERRLP
jgi:hypothetical protein